MDAAIIFADILLILEPLGVPFTFDKGHGPRILKPVRTAAQVDAIAEQIDAAQSLHYVMDSIRLARRALDVPFDRFRRCALHFGVLRHRGGGSKNYYETKKIMYGDEGLWNSLMARFSAALGGYLNAQIDAGAQAVQLFDSWVGCLSPADYRRYVLPHVQSVFEAVSDRVPTIHFGTGNPELYPLMHEAGGRVQGVDWRTDLNGMWQRLGGPPNCPLWETSSPQCCSRRSK